MPPRGPVPTRTAVRLTLGRVFLLAGLGITCLLAVLLGVLLRGWRSSVMDRARSLREEASGAIALQVEDTIYQAQRVLEDEESLVHLEAVRVAEPLSLETSLFAQLVANLELAALKAVEDRAGRFQGVLRVGLLTEQIDALTRRESAERAPHLVFICDEQGRLVSRLGPADRLREEADGELRVDPVAVPPELRLALAHPMLREVQAGQRLASGDLVSGGRRFLVTLRGLERTQGWRLGILVPADHYLGAYVTTRNRALAAAGLILVAIGLVGGVAARAMGRGLGRIVEATTRMASFEFGAAEPRSAFRDVEDVMRSLEL